MIGSGVEINTNAIVVENVVRHEVVRGCARDGGTWVIPVAHNDSISVVSQVIRDGNVVGVMPSMNPCSGRIVDDIVVDLRVGVSHIDTMDQRRLRASVADVVDHVVENFDIYPLIVSIGAPSRGQDTGTTEISFAACCNAVDVVIKDSTMGCELTVAVRDAHGDNIAGSGDLEAIDIHIVAVIYDGRFRSATYFGLPPLYRDKVNARTGGSIDPVLKCGVVSRKDTDRVTSFDNVSSGVNRFERCAPGVTVVGVSPRCRIDENCTFALVKYDRLRGECQQITSSG